MGFNNNHFTCAIGIPLARHQSKKPCKVFCLHKSSGVHRFCRDSPKTQPNLSLLCTDSNVFTDTYTASMSELL